MLGRLFGGRAIFAYNFAYGATSQASASLFIHWMA